MTPNYLICCVMTSAIARHCWFRHYLTGYMGEHTASKLLRTVQWRHWRRHLEHGWRVALYARDDCVHGRDGVHGAGRRR
jgi:hypothetical protein